MVALIDCGRVLVFMIAGVCFGSPQSAFLLFVVFFWGLFGLHCKSFASTYFVWPVRCACLNFNHTEIIFPSFGLFDVFGPPIQFVGLKNALIACVCTSKTITSRMIKLSRKYSEIIESVDALVQFKPSEQLFQASI